VDGNEFVIEGWFFELQNVRNNKKIVSDYQDLGILLYDLKNDKNESGLSENKGIFAKTEFVDRKDINKYFECEYDYSHSGFIAKISTKMIDLENGDYQIIFKPNKYENRGVTSSAYIHNGELRLVSPDDYFDVDAKGTDIENIIENGICLACCPEYHMCVYQYEESLYWIADEGFSFEEDGSTYMRYVLDTTQYELLPKESITDGSYCDNRSFWLESCFLPDDMDCGKYTVSKMDIPKDYAIVAIETGYATYEGMVWQRILRPVYLYN